MKFQKVLLGHVYVGTNLSSCQFSSPQSKAEHSGGAIGHLMKKNQFQICIKNHFSNRVHHSGYFGL